MRTTQRAALSMFIERGFDRVTVGEIAAEVGMAPSTLYRHFRTKEDIVMWDEHDAAIDDALGRALAKKPPLEALRSVFVDELANRYNADLDFQLLRIRYIYATEQLHAAAIEADLRTRAELTAGLEQTMTKPNRPAAAIIAGASLLALDIAIDRWQSDNGEQPLTKRIEESFRQLEQINDLA
ncbi:MAG: AcrR family transcriptional regulator [Candidatus Aldehydirespiratoraceae bacterium]|jgi:AcrR family transcriptional regulator